MNHIFGIIISTVCVICSLLASKQIGKLKKENSQLKEKIRQLQQGQAKAQSQQSYEEWKAARAAEQEHREP